MTDISLKKAKNTIDGASKVYMYSDVKVKAETSRTSKKPLH